MEAVKILMDGSEESAIQRLNFFKNQLISYRATSQKPLELEWEIKLYDFMLKDPAKRLDQYHQTRRLGNGCLRSKREVAKILGWAIE